MSKRDYLNHLKRNCNSIGSGNTLVPVLINKVKPPKDRGNPRSPYMLICTAMVTKPTMVRFGVKDDNKKQKTESVDEEREDLGVVVEAGTTLIVNCFDRNGSSKLGEADFVDLSVSASNYTDPKTNITRVTYKADRVMFKKQTSALNKHVYERGIIDSAMSEVPTRFNLMESDFPDESNPKHMTRNFILPLSNDQKKFEEVVVVLEDDQNNMVCKKDDKEYVGFCTSDGDKSSNSIGIVFKPFATEEDQDPDPIMLKLMYVPSLWISFGIDDVDLWKPVAKRIMSNLRNAYVYGYSSVEQINSLKSNKQRALYDENGENAEEDPSGIIDTAGFAIRFSVDMIETIKNCGLELESDFVEQFFESRQYLRDYQPYGCDPEKPPKHPLNNGFKNKLEAGTGAIYNISEIHSDDIDKFFKSAKNCKKIKYFGVFSDDAPYEANDVTDFINENNIKPELVFGIVEP